MTLTRAERIIGQWQEMRGHQDNHRSLWDDIARYIYPQRRGFMGEITPGTRRTNDLFDNTPMLANQQLAAITFSMTVPKDEQWGRAVAADERLREQVEVQRWFDEANKRVHKAIYDARGNFRRATGESFKDMCAFGPGVIWHGEGKNKTHQSFKSIWLKRCVFGQNADGIIDTVIVQLCLTASQAINRGLPVPDSVRDAYERGKGDTKVEYLHHVAPAIPGEDDGRAIPIAPFVSTMVEMSEKRIISANNAESLPYHVFRWDTVVEEQYGWAPGRLALPDSGTLNQMTRTLLKGGQMAVDPAILTPSARQLNMSRLIPGGPIIYDIEQAKALGGRFPIQPFTTGTNVPLGNDMVRDRREMIWNAFLRNVLQLPTDGPQMTATEVVERRREFLNIVEPTFGGLEVEFSAPVFTRAFEIELLSGRLTANNEMPESLSDAEIEYQFSSPVQKIRERVEAASINAILEQASGIGQIRPEVFDNADLDQAFRDIMSAFGPSRWLRAKDDVAKIREGRVRQAEAQAQQEQLAQVAQAAPKTTEEVVGNLANAAGLVAA